MRIRVVCDCCREGIFTVDEKQYPDKIKCPLCHSVKGFTIWPYEESERKYANPKANKKRK